MFVAVIYRAMRQAKFGERRQRRGCDYISQKPRG